MKHTPIPQQINVNCHYMSIGRGLITNSKTLKLFFGKYHHRPYQNSYWDTFYRAIFNGLNKPTTLDLWNVNLWGTAIISRIFDRILYLLVLSGEKDHSWDNIMNDFSLLHKTYCQTSMFLLLTWRCCRFILHPHARRTMVPKTKSADIWCNGYVVWLKLTLCIRRYRALGADFSDHCAGSIIYDWHFL